MGCHTWFFREKTETEKEKDRLFRIKIMKNREHPLPIVRFDDFTDNDMPHDIFRTRGYPEIRLQSLEETLKYIKDNTDSGVVYGLTEHCEKRLKRFWKNHPNGFIEFG